MNKLCFWLQSKGGWLQKSGGRTALHYAGCDLAQNSEGLQAYEVTAVQVAVKQVAAPREYCTLRPRRHHCQENCRRRSRLGGADLTQAPWRHKNRSRSREQRMTATARHELATRLHLARVIRDSFTATRQRSFQLTFRRKRWVLEGRRRQGDQKVRTSRSKRSVLEGRRCTQCAAEETEDGMN